MKCKDFLRQWRSWIRPLLIGLYVITLVIALPLLIIELNLRGTRTHTQAWVVAGLFVVMALPISVWGIVQHMIHYTQPHLQRHIIRILWMVPIYAMDAWLALRFQETAIYLDTLRECYEAYVVYNFMAYLLSYLTSEYSDLDEEISSKPQVKHFVPFCCFPSWPMGRPLIQYCKHGVLQYTVVRPLTTCISLLCQMAGVYTEGDFSFSNSWTYLALANNISQVWAMYCLVLFYLATKEQLAPIQPVGKFMCIKAVVFLTFWQAVLIAILVKAGVIRADNTQSLDFSTEDIATGLQDFIICVEMFFAAIAHYFSFSHKPFVEPDGRQADCFTSFLAMWDVSDVRNDVVDHVRHVGQTVSRTLRRTPGGQNERTPLLQDGAGEGESYNNTNSLGNVADFDVSQGSNSARRSSIGTAHSLDNSITDTVSRLSFTASMNNYMDLSEGGDIHPGKNTGTIEKAEGKSTLENVNSAVSHYKYKDKQKLKLTHRDACDTGYEKNTQQSDISDQPMNTADLLLPQSLSTEEPDTATQTDISGAVTDGASETKNFISVEATSQKNISVTTKEKPIIQDCVKEGHKDLVEKECDDLLC